MDKGQEAARKTSELTALAVWTGEVTLRAEEAANKAAKRPRGGPEEVPTRPWRGREEAAQTLGE